MLSKNLHQLIGSIRSETSSESQIVALDFAAEQLSLQAPKTACLRCNKANFFVEFEKPNPQSKFKEWNFYLGSCTAGIALEPQEFGSGVIMLNAPFCNGQNADSSKINSSVGKPIKSNSSAKSMAQSEFLKFSQREV